MRILLAVMCCLIGSCTYLKTVLKQSNYAKINEVDPSLRNLKHMLDRQTFFLYGRIVAESHSLSDVPLAIAAFSDRFKKHELVDLNHIAHVDTHFGLNLPEGKYELLVFADINLNGSFETDEVIGSRQVLLDKTIHPEMVAENIDILVSDSKLADWSLSIPVPEPAMQQESIFFPKGSIRSLDDPIFNSKMSQLGLYEPAAFYETAPTLFYALEEDSYKIPVVFVHGINGSPREFSGIIEGLDQSIYKPWFFYYASGGDLDQLAKLFFDIFLSGRVVSGNVKMVIVAHSMGGLVVREALNRFHGNEQENEVSLFVSIATPFGGHPSAVQGAQHAPLILPSWRDLNPHGAFIENLYRKPLAPNIKHQLVYTFGDTNALKVGANSDGVVPLSSQLYPKAQQQASAEFGFDASHAGVLADPDAIAHIIKTIEQIEFPYSKSHLEANMAGGFDVVLGDDYSNVEKYYIHQRGKYMLLLAKGALDPLGKPSLEHFVAVAQGRAEAQTPPETAWLKFVRDFPWYLEQ